MAGDQRRSRADRQGSEGGEPNRRLRKIVHKTKRLERVERAIELRAFALKLLGERGCWTTLFHGPEVLRFENSRFLIMFYVKQPVPLELRERFRIGPLGWGWISGTPSKAAVFIFPRATRQQRKALPTGSTGSGIALRIPPMDLWTTRLKIF